LVFNAENAPSERFFQGNVDLARWIFSPSVERGAKSDLP
jgi:hypothetical protein